MKHFSYHPFGEGYSGGTKKIPKLTTQRAKRKKESCGNVNFSRKFLRSKSAGNYNQWRVWSQDTSLTEVATLRAARSRPHREDRRRLSAAVYDYVTQGERNFIGKHPDREGGRNFSTPSSEEKFCSQTPISVNSLFPTCRHLALDCTFTTL